MSFDPVAKIFHAMPREDRRYPLLGTAVLVVAVLFAAMAVLGHGFLPPDDALRHAAQAVCKKPWHEILVLAKPMLFDFHAGWTWLLHRLADAGLSAEDLVCFSYVFFFLAVLLPPVFLARRSEAWGIAVIVAVTLGLLSPVRLMLGRPFLSQVSVMLMMGFLFDTFKRKEFPKTAGAVLFAAMTLSLWFRCGWLLFIIPLGCLLVAGEWRVFWRMTLIWGVACLVAATLCRDWSGFFIHSTTGLLGSVGRDLPSWALVSELVPATPPFLALLPILFFLAIRFFLKDKLLHRLRDPLLILTLAGWVLMLQSSRFWGDFGLPALMVWMTKEFSDLLDRIPGLRGDGKGRFVLCSVVGGIVFLLISTDVNGRWGRGNYQLHADYTNEDIQDLFPDEGGIFYNTDMTFFYQTFFHNPDGHWKYNLGMEAALMPDDNRQIYHNLILYNKDTRLYQGYIDKMTSKDRLVILGAGQPGIPELEWNLLQTGIWSGRLPREAPSR
ncbi:MAG: hypothetical protein RRC34_13385 [Lentisphaeria bacterium]|nr:hypothetical protein [Lentisphaeria bacterium]